MGRAKGIVNSLALGLGQAAETADVEIDPAHRVPFAFLRDQHHLGLQHTGVAHQITARLSQGAGQPVAEMTPHGALYGAGIVGDLRHFLGIARREAAADVQHG